MTPSNRPLQLTSGAGKPGLPAAVVKPLAAERPAVRRTRDQGGQMSRMRWSQLKTALSELCAPELRSRVALHQARYRYTREEVGRVWVTIDGREVAYFDTMSYIRRRSELGAALLTPQSGGGETSSPNAHFEADEKARAALRASGQYDDYEALADLEAYLSMGVDAALRCPSPLVRALAVIDRRVGKRTLRKLAVGAEHQLVPELYLLRSAAEGIDVAL